MIIFGTRGVTYTKDRGTFFCPQCGDQEEYRHKRARRFFTLYFVPVIPLDLVGEYIECPRCRGTFKKDVLSYDPNAAAQQVEAQFHIAVRRVMVEMMMADGEIDPSEIEVIRNVYQQLTGAVLSEDDLTKTAEEAEAGRGIMEYLGEIAPRLNANGKELVLKAALMVAAADGVLQEEEKEVISTIAGGLEMSQAHVRGIFAEMMQPAAADGETHQ